MKTIVLTGVLCVLLAGVYGVLHKTKPVVATIVSKELQRTAQAADTITQKAAASKTLDDSHWIEEPLIETAEAPELITDNDVAELAAPKKNAKREATKVIPESSLEVPIMEMKQLLYEVEEDTIRRTLPTYSI